jgi:hypothetical protein
VIVLWVALLASAAEAQGQVGSAPSSPDAADAQLAQLVTSLRADLVRRDPAWASARVVVAPLPDDIRPWTTPLGVWLHERLTAVVERTGGFRSPARSLSRGITLEQVQGASTLSGAAALGQLYGAEIVLEGGYRVEGERVRLSLRAVDGQDRVLAEASVEVPVDVIPLAGRMAEVNAEHTSRLASALQRLGWRQQGAWRVAITTNRPGTGASFRQGEEIRYFVTSTMEGYLYLFHVDAAGRLLRVLPNKSEPNNQVRAGTALEIPGRGAPYRFVAAPPFGLETTVALVTSQPLDEREFRVAEGGFSEPVQEIPALVTTRGLRLAPSSTAPSGASAAGPITVWDAVTVLIRP